MTEKRAEDMVHEALEGGGGTTQFIQEVINDRNGKFVFDGEFIESTEVRTHSPRTFFL